jgi:IclR family acetate operon transcriptional repressor
MSEGIGTEDVTTLRTLSRGIRLLEAIAEGNGTATAKTLSRRLGIKIGTCYHLLRTLREAEYVIRHPGGTFDLGPHALSLGRSLIAPARPEPELSVILTRLHNKTRETSYISGWHRGMLILQDFIESDQSLRVGGLGAGYTRNLHSRASGKAVLAFLPPEQVEAMFLGVPLPRLTPRTIHDYEGLITSLASVRQQRYAVDVEEFALGVCCVSAPFFSPDQRPAGAFSISAPLSRFGASQSRLVSAVQEAAAMASNLLRTGRLATPEQPRADHSAASSRTVS